MKLLLIGDERKIRRLVAWGFATEPFSVKLASSRSEVEKLADQEQFQAACIDGKMRGENAAAILEVLHDRAPALPVVVLIGEDDPERSLRVPGVVAQLASPFSIGALHMLIKTHALPEAISARHRTREASVVTSVAAAAPAVSMMANDETAHRTFELARRAARSNAAILILGETGTGKSLLAQAIHQQSLLHEKPFVTINCPCLSRELLESDLFGHVRGSFTGAVQDTLGKVAIADGGTLFLDEIGDMPMALQPKLLRLLQEKQYERVGEATSRVANVRIIAATNRDLKRRVAAGQFREDLYYRLNVIAIDVPPLRSRTAQILGAAEAFLATICRQLGKPSPRVSDEARQILETYPWPGNLRELRNVIERAAILSNSSVLEAHDFPALLTQIPASRCQIGGAISLSALEDAHIQMVVANSTSLEEAARILKIDKSTLYRKRKQMEARVEVFAAQKPNREFDEVAVATGS